MKTKPASDANGASANGTSRMGKKQKNQLIVLGTLSGLLVAVLAVQFGRSETEYEVAALAADIVIPTEPEQAPEVAVVVEKPVQRDNPVLSAAPPEGALARNPFTNFWNREEGGSGSAERLPPPKIALGLTLPSDSTPLAIIDGRLRFLGDEIQGWRLAEVRTRAVVLQSPAEERLVVEMPVHLRVLDLPPSNLP